MLYPLVLKPTYHYRIWGGDRLKQYKSDLVEEKIGESWELSTIPNAESIVLNGKLKGKNLVELVEEYGEELLGKKVIEKYGKKFPLLVKLLDASEPLSVQVHPNDVYAKKHHDSFGKTEIWYVLEAEEDAEIIVGFEKEVDKEVYKKHVEEGTLEQILRKVHPEKGDVFYIPSGRVHAMGKGLTLVEIQQSSDVTYRIYDYNRVDKDGKKRELHTNHAMNVSDFNYIESPKELYDKNAEKTTIIKSPFFTIDKRRIDEKEEVKTTAESFKIIICIEGDIKIDNDIKLEVGHTVLLPAGDNKYSIMSDNNAQFLEIYI